MPIICPRCKKNEITNVPEIWLERFPNKWECYECAFGHKKSQRVEGKLIPCLGGHSGGKVICK